MKIGRRKIAGGIYWANPPRTVGHPGTLLLFFAINKLSSLEQSYCS
jgi:hypothetical protein